ncbi:MAG: TlpA family protein disulfide reductase [Caldisericia bacterium]|nr:TlpA family protein disulfide reductase [Caldisericia bacterium]
MKKICITLMLVVSFAGCGQNNLPVVRPESVNFPVLSAIGDKISDVYSFSWLNPNGTTGTWKPTKKTLMSFWIYGCASCLPEITAIEEFSKQTKLDIVVVNLNKTKDIPLLSDMINQLDEPLTVTMILDPGSDISRLYGVSTVPDAMVIDGNGRILARQKARIDLDTLVMLEKRSEEE